MAHSIPKVPSVFGGVLLVVGNVIGAGILALPMALAQLGFFYATLSLAFFWLLMMLGAYYFLEATLALPPGANLVSMAKHSLGRPGVALVWVCNLLVMYSLLAAYMSGGGDLIHAQLDKTLGLPAFVYPLLFLLLFGFIVFKGIRATDYTNRILMLLKSAIFLLMVLALGFKTDFSKLALFSGPLLGPISGPLLLVVLTSYGFATLIPSLRNYYHSEVKPLRKIVFLGTFLPFLCYLVWVSLLFALIGPKALAAMASAAQPLSALQSALDALHMGWMVKGMYVFSSICILTSFLANSLSLTHFIEDGFNKYGFLKAKTVVIYAATYLPPLLAVCLYPKIFLLGLSVAGFLAIVQLLIVPGLALWVLRYVNTMPNKPYTVMGGKALLGGFVLLSGLILLAALMFR